MHAVLQVTGHSLAVFPLAHLLTLCLSLWTAGLFLPPEAQLQFLILPSPQLDCHVLSLSWHLPSAVGVATGVATGFNVVGVATGVATGHPVVGEATGFDVVGEATGFDVVGVAAGQNVSPTGFDVVGVATGVATGHPVVGEATGDDVVSVGVATGVAVSPSQVNVFNPSAYTNTRATPGEELASIEHTFTMRFPAAPQE